MTEVTLLYKILITRNDKNYVFYQTENYDEFVDKLIECTKNFKNASIKSKVSFNNYKNLYLNFQLSTFFIINGQDKYDS